jgi:hypothetical protein
MGDMHYTTRHFHRTPSRPSLPGTVFECEQALELAVADLARAKRATGTYSDRAYASQQRSIANAESRISALELQLARLRGEFDEVLP